MLASSAIGILPVAATEPHGPHLPLSTDCDIAEGHLAALADYLPPHRDVVVLPLQRIGASREHDNFPGNQSLPVVQLVADWMALIDDFAGRGGRRLVIVSSHGGNTPVVDTLILEARARHAMLAVGTAWLRFGQPEGLFSEDERRYGIHGGAIETALMLHYAPDRVDMAKADSFVSTLPQWERDMSLLRAYGPHRFGWMSSDLNPLGVVGDARIATAAMGALSADHALKGFVQLLEDVARFDLGRFGDR